MANIPSITRFSHYQIQASPRIIQSAISHRIRYLSTDSKESSETYQDMSPKKCTIYTDGACTRNGTQDARGGIGVYWGKGNSSNVSEPLGGGRQTNQRAEIEAASRGIQQARDKGYDEVTVRTDSHYVKNAAESWIPNWERQGWTKDIVNKQEFQHLQQNMKDIKVNFEYVPSDSNAADSLAKSGAQK